VKDYASLMLLPMTTLERETIEALVYYGSQQAAADGLGWKRSRVQSRLRAVQARQKAASEAVAKGKDGYLP
jgi:hypothetical protein